MTTIPTVKLNSGDDIPVLGLGTWLIGGDKVRNPNNDDEGQMRAVRNVLDHGVTLIDTASNYAEGHCEELLGKVLKDYKRDTLFVTSRVTSKAITKEGIIENAQASLKRLKTEYFDLFLIGASNPDIPLERTVEGLLYLLKNKITKNIGVANFRLNDLKKIQQLTGNKIMYNQFHYNLIMREAEVTELLRYCQDTGVVLTAYRPLQLGLLARPGNMLLDTISAKYHKTQAQISLKWLLSKKGVITIPKFLDSQHIDEDIDLFSWQLEKEDIENLDKNFPGQLSVSDANPPKTPYP